MGWRRCSKRYCLGMGGEDRALEREEKKDGILGREVFDGDDMLDSPDNDVINWPRRRRDAKRFWTKSRPPHDDGGGGDTAFTSSAEELGHGRKMACKAARLQASHGNLEDPTSQRPEHCQRRTSELEIPARK